MLIGLAVVVVFLGFVLLVWWGQERILFQPPSVYEQPETDGSVDYFAPDGQKLSGYLVGNPSSSRGVLICFHGNADLAMRQLGWARLVADHTAYAVFLAEYRGYMTLGGTPTYESTRLDAAAARNHVLSIATAGVRLAYFGHSLGSGIATELAQKHPPSALVLQSPFTSARAMARLMVSPPVEFLWRRVSRIHFDTVKVVSNLRVAVSVAHGKRDRIVPFGMGRDVFAAAARKGEFLAVEDAGHNDVAVKGGSAYWAWIQKALDAQEQHDYRPDK